MQLFDEIINGILTELENLSIEINKTIQLNKENYFIDVISNLYFKRGKTIEKFLECKKRSEWDVFIEKNNYINEFIERIQKIEQDNIVMINKNIENISSNIKNLMKQKSLLIYMKS